MINVDSLKDQLISGLWLPIVKEGGDIFYKRLKKNKKMKLFTLTSDGNFNEIVVFEENNLIQRADAVCWTQSSIKKIRLETESIGLVLGCSVYEDSIMHFSFQANDHFARDIINLDYSSQEPELGNGRIEREIASVEKTIKLQKDKSGDKFVLIYTTLIDSNTIDRDSIIQTSDALAVNGWTGLNIVNFSQPISDISQKKTFIEETIKKLNQKYGYIVTKITSSELAIPGHQEKLYSIAGIFKR